MRIAVIAACTALAIVFAATPAQALGGSPAQVPLGGAARAVAFAPDGSFALVAAADGLYAFTAHGALLYHALPGIDVRAVAVDRHADRIVAGGANGLVYALTGAGAVEAVALGAGGAVDSVAISDDGATLVGGGGG
ncbi:MAG: hypothetical protein ACYDCK_08075, partial [Thermoplasmatota archaeon]